MSAPLEAPARGALLAYSTLLFPKAASPPSLSARVSQGTSQGGQDGRGAGGELALPSCLTSLPPQWSPHPVASDDWLLGIMLPDLGMSPPGPGARAGRVRPGVDHSSVPYRPLNPGQVAKPL